jgi:hypothetical protein
MGAAEASRFNAASAYRLMGDRLAAMATDQARDQAKVLARLDGMSEQLAGVCRDVKTINGTVRCHETDITVLKRAWEEQVRPTIAEVRDLKVRIAVICGGTTGGVLALREIIELIVKALGS